MKKVYSINILYFDLGEGADYLYHGQTTLTGVHTKDTLRLTQHEQDDLHVVTPEEYIRPDTTVPGLVEARERLEYLKMSEEDRRVYDHYLDTLIRDTDVMKTKLLEAEIQGRKQGEAEGLEKGLAEGLEKGRAEGRAQERLTNAKALLANGVPLEVIVNSLHLTDEEAATL